MGDHVGDLGNLSYMVYWVMGDHVVDLGNSGYMVYWVMGGHGHVGNLDWHLEGVTTLYRSHLESIVSNLIYKI